MSFLAKRTYQLLVQHTVYDKIVTMDCVRSFMEHHVICVWSYHTILKQLQSDLIQALQPFGRERVREALHLMSQLILEEEVGQTADGRYVSLLELYLESLQSIGGDANHMLIFFDEMETGKDMVAAARAAHFTPALVSYVEHTAHTLRLNPLQKAVTLFYETEPFIPLTLLDQLERLNVKDSLDDLLTYFHLHLQGTDYLDGSPMSQLVAILGGDCEMLEDESNQAAEGILKERFRLWNELEAKLEQMPQTTMPVITPRHLRLVR